MTESRDALTRMMPDAFPIFFRGRNPYPAQATVMPSIVRGRNTLLAAPTASGKTEAVIAPLYQRHVTFRRGGMSTIYVAPTKALVNDLYERLFTYLGTRNRDAIARYTGDRHEFKRAEGVFCVVVTPEALDSLQLRRPKLLQNVRSVVVDEIHLLHGQARGQQLRHVIDRIRAACVPAASDRDTFQIAGMTATLNDMERVAALWLGDDADIFSEGGQREIEAEMIALEPVARDQADRMKAQGFARWLRDSGAEKALVFSNSRNSAHAMAAHLSEELEGTRWPVHLHFGALPATQREQVETRMRSDRFGVCVATSTLEIGIDIGDVDMVVLADLPRSVSGFLQRIGRGNRRTDVCKVIAFRSSDDDQKFMDALLECARAGTLDDVYEYDRPSVRFQQVLSLAWRATREDRALTLARLETEAGTDQHRTVALDMLTTGCLNDVRGALIPSDVLIDEGDAGRIHTVLRANAAGNVIDLNTGDPALNDYDLTGGEGALFHGGTMRRVRTGNDGEAYLGEAVKGSVPLVNFLGTGPAPPMSRSIVWALARQAGHEPKLWQPRGRTLLTWGGQTLNTLLAALFSRSNPEGSFQASSTAIQGDISTVDVSIENIRALAKKIETANDLPLSVASKFVVPSRYSGDLSANVSAQEKRRAVPWPLLHDWLDQLSEPDSEASSAT